MRLFTKYPGPSLRWPVSGVDHRGNYFLPSRSSGTQSLFMLYFPPCRLNTYAFGCSLRAHLPSLFSHHLEAQEQEVSQILLRLSNPIYFVMSELSNPSQIRKTRW